MTSQGRRFRSITGPVRGIVPSRIAARAFALLAAAPLFAHDFWIEPDSFRPGAGTVVAVHLRVGQNFDGDLVPRANHLIERFVLVTVDGETPIVGPDAGEPAGRVRPGAAGPAVIGYRSLTTPVELDAAKFEAYLREEGLETIIETRAQRGESARPGKEIYSRCAKSLLAVGPAAPGPAAAAAPGSASAAKAPASKSTAKVHGKPPPLHQRPLGFTLEIVPLADPFTMKPGATLPVMVLHEGKPLANVLVVAMNAEAPLSKIRARSDKAGRARLTLDRPGFWLVKAVLMRPAPAASGADWESFWASVTFELPEPG
jgi:hypothetical protein